MLQKVLLQSARAGKPFKKASAAPKRHPPGKISKRRHPPGKPWTWGSMFTAFLKDAMHVLLTAAGHTMKNGGFLKESACGCLKKCIRSTKKASARQDIKKKASAWPAMDLGKHVHSFFEGCNACFVD
jgi:hypothetical protein